MSSKSIVRTQVRAVCVDSPRFVEVVTLLCPCQGRSASSYLREVLTSKGGVWSLTRGMVPTVLHTIPSTTVFFGSYDIFYNMVFHEEEGLARPLLAGGCAGMVEWAVTFPIDTFKTRYQASSSKSLGKSHFCNWWL